MTWELLNQKRRTITAQKVKFSIKDFFSKCDQILQTTICCLSTKPVSDTNFQNNKSFQTKKRGGAFIIFNQKLFFIWWKNKKIDPRNSISQKHFSTFCKVKVKPTRVKPKKAENLLDIAQYSSIEIRGTSFCFFQY